MDQTTEDRIIFLSIAFCFLGQATVVKWTTCCNLVGHCCASCCQLLSKLRSLLTDEDTPEAEDCQNADREELQRKVLSWQLWFFKNCLAGSQACMGVFSLYILVGKVMGTKRVWTGSQDFMFLVCYLFTVLLQKIVSRQAIVAESTRLMVLLGIYYAINTLGTTAIAWGYTDSWVIAWEFGLLSWRLFVVPCIPKKRWIIMGCLVHSTVHLTRVYTVDVKLMFSALLIQVVSAGCLLLLTQSCRRFVVMQTRATQEAQTGRHVTERLLDLLCDAVAHVDWDLRFMSHSAKLAGTLLLGSHRDLKGSRLQDLLEDRDQQILEVQTEHGTSSIG
eukprot:TRINITY_DN30124_c0_g1_i2.p1 TRINITY_DN30124_c0_g1~~TRINITY_DN30124_c0_g1_i2.p1  ORF type:complete len:332 (+),score=34.40 TRINITY_DN30124_c0_g1_i2:93-1088(+)